MKDRPHTNCIGASPPLGDPSFLPNRILVFEDAAASAGSVGHMGAPRDRAAPPEAKASPAHAGVLDPEVVDQLRALAQAGNSDLLGRLQSSFARDTPARLSALRAGLAAGDAAAVAFNVHTLKGSAANLGAREIVATCEQIENAPAAATERGLEPLLAQLERNAADAQAELALLAEAG
jgi:HPt (histidine-containing phosphotransfer) domain-containing protein